jgi:hypothetical protein
MPEKSLKKFSEKDSWKQEPIRKYRWVFENSVNYCSGTQNFGYPIPVISRMIMSPQRNNFTGDVDT